MKIIKYALSALIVYVVGYAYLEFIPLIFDIGIPSISECGFIFWLVNLVFAIASPILFTAIAIGIALTLIYEVMSM